MEPEVLVVGGGPAGAAVALALARAGRRVTLLERLRGPADKVCGEFLSVEALESLAALGIDLDTLDAPRVTCVRLAERELIAEARLPFPARSMTRRALDETLLDCAEQAGVEVRRGAQVEALEREDKGWRVDLADRAACHAPAVLIATGKHDLRGRPRGRGLHDGLVAFKQYFRLSEEQHRELGDTVELILFKGGYAGLQPVGGDAVNLCLLVHRSQLRTIAASWERVQAHLKRCSPYLARRLHGAEPLLARPLALSSIPYGYLRRRTEPGLWWLGDQAAVIPSFSGDGMSIALHSAAVAARMYLSGEDSERYQRTLARSLTGQVLRATAVSQLLVRLPAAARLARAWPGVLSLLASATRVQSRRPD